VKIISIDEDLAAKISKIAAERGTTLTSLICSRRRALVEKRADAVDQKAKLGALQRSVEDEIRWREGNVDERRTSREAVESRAKEERE
jgi:hypothetical protein